MLLGQKTSLLTCSTLSIVVFGFVLGTDGDLNFSVWGTVFGVLASMCVSLYSIETKSALALVDHDKFKLAAYSNTLAVVLFPPLIVLTGETAQLWEHVDLLVSPEFWAMMVFSGMFGFAIGIVRHCVCGA